MTHARTLEPRRLPAAVTLALALVAAQGCRVGGYGVELRTVTVTPGALSTSTSAAQQLTATGRYNDDTERDLTAEAAWRSSDPAVATVDGAGLVTPLQPGTVTISATAGGRSGSTALTVTSAQLQAIEVTPASPSIPNGTRLQLTATGHLDDGTSQDLTAQVTWSSSAASLTVDDGAAKGLASSTALGAATATVTATLGAISGATTVTVRDARLASLSVAPATATVKTGHGQQFTAAGAFSDGSSHDMTAEVAWSASPTSVARVGPAGSATGLFAGQATITATSSALLGSVSATAQLTVQAAAPGY